MEKLLLTEKEVRQQIGLSRSKIYDLINPETGCIPSFREGTRILVFAEGVHEWVAKRLAAQRAARAEGSSN